MKKIINEDLRFNFEKFKSLPNNKQRYRHLRKTAKRMGEGAARAVFYIGNGKVIKLAKTFIDPYAIKQNKEEIDLWENSSLRPFLAKIYDYDDDSEWILSEAVQSIVDNKQLQAKFNVPPEILDRIENYVQFGHEKYLMKTLEKFINSGKITDKDEELIYKIYNLNKLGIWDIGNYEHWGMVPDGRLVLMDSGISGDYFS